MLSHNNSSGNNNNNNNNSWRHAVVCCSVFTTFRFALKFVSTSSHASFVIIVSLGCVGAAIIVDTVEVPWRRQRRRIFACKP